MALRKDSLESTDWGRLCSTFDAAATAIAPVSSATRSLAEDTAGAEAPLKGINPNAATTLGRIVRKIKTRRMTFSDRITYQAIVLAVPITPHVPTWKGVRERLYKRERQGR